jgi:hypothetical protein
MDNAPYRETVRDHEGADGGFIDAEFEKARDIILEGSAFATVGSVETYLDSLKANYAPVTTPIPFYFKPGGVDERLIYVKPRGCRYDWEQARRTGMTNIQFLMVAEDPRFYSSVLGTSVVAYGGDGGLGFGFTRYYDDFARLSTDTWGTATTGNTYTLTGTAADFDVNGDVGTIVLTAATGTAYYALINGMTSVIDHYIFAREVTFSATPTGGSVSQLFDMRFVDANNFYRVELIRTTGNATQVQLVKLVAGAPTTIASAVTIGSATATSSVSVLAEAVRGSESAAISQIRVKVWLSSDPEPVAWTLDVKDSSITSAGGVRVGAVRNAGNTNVNPIAAIGTATWWQGFGFDFGFGGGATPAGTTLAVGGNRPTPVEFIITGPVINPVIYNTTTGDVLAFAIELSASDTLTINTLNRTVYLNGNINRRNTMTMSDWFFLNPESVSIAYGAGTGVGSTLTINFRSAWR